MWRRRCLTQRKFRRAIVATKQFLSRTYNATPDY